MRISMQVAERLCWAHDAGLVAVLDMHEDIYGEGFGFDGAPRVGVRRGALRGVRADRSVVLTRTSIRTSRRASTSYTRRASSSSSPRGGTSREKLAIRRR